MVSEETVLYKHYDADEMPIYYGISRQNEVRQGVHQLYSVWTEFSARCTEQSYPTRQEAEDAERAAIKSDRPVFNQVHNDTDCIERAVQYLARKERYDLLQPRSARPVRGARHDPNLVAFIESKPLGADGCRLYGGMIRTFRYTDAQVYALYEHGSLDCPCPMHHNLPIRPFVRRHD